MRIAFKKLTRMICVALAATLALGSFCPSLLASSEAAPADSLVKESISKAIADSYVEPTYQNLSKMYWALGKFDLANDDFIDDYLRINECEMYQKFYHDDFEWENVRKATRSHITNNLSTFPTRFELLSVISVGRYNIEKEEFELEDESKLIAAKRLEVNTRLVNQGDRCYRASLYPVYPPNLVVALNRPLTIENFHVKPALAQLYLEETKDFYAGLPLDYQAAKYERLAFLRLKVRVTQYKGLTTVTAGEVHGLVFGVVEGYEVYADQEKLKPLFSKQLDTGRFNRVRPPKSAEDSPADSVTP